MLLLIVLRWNYINFLAKYQNEKLWRRRVWPFFHFSVNLFLNDKLWNYLLIETNFDWLLIMRMFHTHPVKKYLIDHKTWTRWKTALNMSWTDSIKSLIGIFASDLRFLWNNINRLITTIGNSIWKSLVNETLI